MSNETETNDVEVVEATEPKALTARNVTPEKKRQKLRRWVQKLALILAILGPLVFIIAALGYRIGLFDLGTSLGTLSRKVAPAIMVMAIIASIISLFMCFAISPKKKGLVISLVALVIPVVGMLKAKGVGDTVAKLPFIHDVTTDTEDPPVFSKAIEEIRAKTAGVNTLTYIEKKDAREKKLVSVLQAKHYPDIRTVLRSEKPDAVFKEAQAVVKSLGWDVVTENEEDWIIEATDTTFWYGFKDDVIIRIRPSKNGGSLVDMRSISRIGGSDLGANAERIRLLMEGLEEK